VIDDDDEWLNAPLTPEELDRAERAAFGPMYDMNTLERIMLPWNQIEASAQEAVLLQLKLSMKNHIDHIKEAEDTPVGPLVHAIERHQAMIEAITAAMKFLASTDLVDTANWVAVEAVRKDFIIGGLLRFYLTSQNEYKYARDNGLIHGAQRFDDISEAAYVAAVTLGWVIPKVLSDPADHGSWDLVRRMREDDAKHVFTASWTVDDGTSHKKGKKGKKK
jgi:hypothetical protein